MEESKGGGGEKNKCIEQFSLTCHRVDSRKRHCNILKSIKRTNTETRKKIESSLCWISFIGNKIAGGERKNKTSKEIMDVPLVSLEGEERTRIRI